MAKIKLDFKIWILIIAVFLALVMIKPSFDTGVEIKSIARDSPSYEAGLRQGMIITQINGISVENLEGFTNAVSNLFDGEEFKRVNVIANRREFIVFTNDSLDLTVENIPKSNIRFGLDLQGGARALVKPENASLTQEQLADLIDITNERFNVFGISDIVVRPVSDLEGNNYMMIEIAGATPSDLENLIGEQGEFKAKIANQTVFEGGSADIPYVCRQDATCARIASCNQAQDGMYYCRFEFSISLSEAAAKKHASITNELEVIVLETGERYLEEKLELYVDDVLADSLYISEGLKGVETTQIQISGSGSGKTREEAVTRASENMKRLQTILITGGLPYKLEIVKLDTISPALGTKFLSYLAIAGTLALLGVALIIFLRYRKLKISLAVLLTSFSEVIIILGFTTFIQ
jgi:preprotein translocase subunit SecD